MFTLNVKEDNEHLCPETDDKEGVYRQKLAFAHIIPSGKCHISARATLITLAELHGWQVVIKKQFS